MAAFGPLICNTKACKETSKPRKELITNVSAVSLLRPVGLNTDATGVCEALECD